MLNGPAAFARALNVSKQRVSNWRKRGVPRDEAANVERATDGAVTCEELCPEVTWLRDGNGIHYVVTCGVTGKAA